MFWGMSMSTLLPPSLLIIIIFAVENENQKNLVKECD
jgi:hypothetical protein